MFTPCFHSDMICYADDSLPLALQMLVAEVSMFSEEQRLRVSPCVWDLQQIPQRSCWWKVLCLSILYPSPWQRQVDKHEWLGQHIGFSHGMLQVTLFPERGVILRERKRSRVILGRENVKICHEKLKNKKKTVLRVKISPENTNQIFTQSQEAKWGTGPLPQVIGKVLPIEHKHIFCPQLIIDGERVPCILIDFL